MRIGNIIAIKKTLDEVCKMDLPIKLSWKLAKVVLKITPFETSFEEQKNKLIRKHGKEELNEKGEKTGSIKVMRGDEPKFFEEFSTLLEMEETIDLPTFDIAEFGEDVKFKPNDLVILSPLLKVD